MAYPDDFDTSAFPAWKRIALSRTAGVWVMVAFFLIILLCIAIPWVVQNEVIEPFVIYVDAPHGKWELVGRQNQKQTIPYYIAMQRAVVGIFVQEWFSLSGNQEKNVDHWGKVLSMAMKIGAYSVCLVKYCIILLPHMSYHFIKQPQKKGNAGM